MASTLVTPEPESCALARAAVVNVLPVTAEYVTVSAAFVQSAAIVILPVAGNPAALVKTTVVAPAK